MRCWRSFGVGLGLLAVLRAIPAPRPPAAVLKADGMQHFYNLEYRQAIADFRQLVTDKPQSASSWNHLSQAELYLEMYRIGALETELYGHGDPFFEEKLLPPNPAAVAAFDRANQRAQALATAAIALHPLDAHAHYNLAVAWALQGTLAFSVNKSYWGALSDAKAARREAEKSVALDPSFVDPELILGVHNYVAGSLPWAVKMLSTLVGYSGNKELGRQQIAAVMAHGENSRSDAAVLLAVVDRRDGLNAQAAPILERLASEYPRNVLFAVEAAEALEAAGEHDAARAQYHLILDRAAAHAPGYQRAPLDRVWYALGKIERLYSHWTQAAADFQKSESQPGALPRYQQAAALAAGQADQRAGQTQAAQAQFQHCLALDPSSPAGQAAARALGH
ncbi:MAG TPA: tetratricopeptide repeat protein [Terriglobales bacterium]|nr:tetratricopeptide repeat protein [Terriglobales bacterium]